MRRACASRQRSAGQEEGGKIGRLTAKTKPKLRHGQYYQENNYLWTVMPTGMVNSWRYPVGKDDSRFARAAVSELVQDPEDLVVSNYRSVSVYIGDCQRVRWTKELVIVRKMILLLAIPSLICHCDIHVQSLPACTKQHISLPGFVQAQSSRQAKCHMQTNVIVQTLSVCPTYREKVSSCDRHSGASDIVVCRFLLGRHQSSHFQVWLVERNKSSWHRGDRVNVPFMIEIDLLWEELSGSEAVRRKGRKEERPLYEGDSVGEGRAVTRLSRFGDGSMRAG